MSDVLIDNFTLQGAFSFLEKRHTGAFFESCLAHLVEAVVLYDRIYVPLDVLERNDAAKHVAALFGEIITGEPNCRLPDFHHHLVDRSIVNSLDPLIGDSFAPYENDTDALIIEMTGIPPSSSFSPGYMGRNQEPTSFAQRHAYYTWFCVRLAAARGFNYAPNPIRESLLAKPDVFKIRGGASIEAKLMEGFEASQAKYFQPISSLLNVADYLQLPLVYTAVRSKAAQPSDIASQVITLRNSKPAMAFRAHCTEVQRALQAGEFEKARKTMVEAQELADAWSRTTKRFTRRQFIQLGLSFFISAGIDVPIPSIIGDPAIKPHFVFVHQLLKLSRKEGEA